jgi:hypothetical protein
MRQDLKHRLITWKNDTLAGEVKKVYLSENPVKKGEYLIKLEKGLADNLAGKIAQISVTKKYLTAAQQDARKDPSADMYNINRIIDSLEREFGDKYDQAINEAFKDEALHFSEI